MAPSRVIRSPALRGAIALASGALVAVAALGASAGLEASIGPLAPSAEPPRGGFAPDPPSTPSTTQRLFDVRVDKGKVSIERVRTVTVKNPEATARLMGRYALELWIGNELLDRIRFNVPLGADLPREDDGRPFRRPSFDRVTTRFTVKMADHPRAVYAKLVDRATGAESKFLWPPRGEVLEPFTPPVDAGTPRDAGVSDAGPPRDGGASDGGPGRDGALDGGPADGGRAVR